MINLRGSELPGLLGLEYCPRSGLVGISHIHCGLGYSIVPDTRWPGLVWSDLVWSNLVWSNAASGFEGIYSIDADADPTTMVKMQSGATMYGMGMIQASIFNVISITVFFM